VSYSYFIDASEFSKLGKCYSNFVSFVQW
jgi:hypothetical protein